MFLIDKMTSINSKQNTYIKYFFLNKKTHIYFISIILKIVFLHLTILIYQLLFQAMLDITDYKKCIQYNKYN